MPYSMETPDYVVLDIPGEISEPTGSLSNSAHNTPQISESVYEAHPPSNMVLVEDGVSYSYVENESFSKNLSLKDAVSVDNTSYSNHVESIENIESPRHLISLENARSTKGSIILENTQSEPATIPDNRRLLEDMQSLQDAMPLEKTRSIKVLEFSQSLKENIQRLEYNKYSSEVEIDYLLKEVAITSENVLSIEPDECLINKYPEPQAFQKVFVPPVRHQTPVSLKSPGSPMLLESIQEQSEEDSSILKANSRTTAENKLQPFDNMSTAEDGSLPYPDFDPSCYTKRFSFVDGVMKNRISQISSASSPEYLLGHRRKIRGQGQSIGYEADVGTPSPTSTPRSMQLSEDITSTNRSPSPPSNTSSVLRPKSKHELPSTMSTFKRQSTAFLNFFNINPNNISSLQQRTKTKRRSTILRIADTIISSLTKDSKPVGRHGKKRGRRPRRKAKKVTTTSVEVYRPRQQDTNSAASSPLQSHSVSVPNQSNEAIIQSLPMNFMHPPLLPMNGNWRNGGRYSRAVNQPPNEPIMMRKMSGSKCNKDDGDGPKIDDVVFTVNQKGEMEMFEVITVNQPTHPPGRIKEVKSMSEFEEALIVAEDSLVCVTFSAKWCGPWRMIKPDVHRLSHIHGDVIFYEVDVDDNEDIAKARRVVCMPTFQFFKWGSMLDKFAEPNRIKLDETIRKLRKCERRPALKKKSSSLTNSRL